MGHITKKIKTFLNKNLLYIIFGQSFIALFGSLFFSEVANFAPCILCWYQRVFMYPICILTAVGIVRKDKEVGYYVLSLSLIGLLISIFHNLLYWGIIPEKAGPCVAGISCTTKFIEWFGFVTIPMLSFIGFSIISICAVAFIKSKKKIIS